MTGRFLVVGDGLLFTACVAFAFTTGWWWMLAPPVFVGFAFYALVNDGAWSA